MAVRKCPQCLTVVPATRVVAYSNSIECPGCKKLLEVSALSRYIGTAGGLVVAALVWQWVDQHGGMLGWVLPIVYAFLAFSIAAPLLLMLTADLRLAAAEPVHEPEPVAAGHASGHGGAQH